MSDPGAPPPPPPPDDPWRPPPPPPPPPGGAGGYGQSDPPPYAQAPPLGYGQQPPYGQPGQYGAPPQYAGYAGYAPAPQNEGTAVGALIASILSWMICPVIPAVVALVMIPGARRKIAESHGRLTGEGLLTAAKWVSLINIGFYLLLAGLLVVLVVIGTLADTSSSSDFSFGLDLLSKSL